MAKKAKKKPAKNAMKQAMKNMDKVKKPKSGKY